MAYEMDTLDVTFLAAADLSGYQYCFMKLTADNTVNVAGAGEAAIGILQNKPNVAGEEARVRVLGVSRIEAGATLAAGDKVGSDGNGEGTPLTADKAIVMGICLDGVTVVGDEVATMLLTGVQTISA